MDACLPQSFPVMDRQKFKLLSVFTEFVLDDFCFLLMTMSFEKLRASNMQEIRESMRVKCASLAPTRSAFLEHTRGCLFADNIPRVYMYIQPSILYYCLLCTWDHRGSWSRSQLSLGQGQFDSGQVSSLSQGHIKRTSNSVRSPVASHACFSSVKKANSTQKSPTTWGVEPATFLLGVQC